MVKIFPHVMLLKILRKHQQIVLIRKKQQIEVVKLEIK